MTMLEKATKAAMQSVKEQMGGKPIPGVPEAIDSWAARGDSGSIDFALVTRAVIEAMREPTGAMLDIGDHFYLKAECGLLDTNVSALHNAWDVMIDEALTGRREKWLSSPLPSDAALSVVKADS